MAFGTFSRTQWNAINATISANAVVTLSVNGIDGAITPDPGLLSGSTGYVELGIVSIPDGLVSVSSPQQVDIDSVVLR